MVVGVGWQNEFVEAPTSLTGLATLGSSTTDLTSRLTETGSQAA